MAFNSVHKFIFFFCSAQLLCFSTPAQNCNPATVAQLPGAWKAGMKNPAGSADAATIAKAKKNTDAFHNLLRSKYSPVGLQVSWSFSSVWKDIDLKIYGYMYSLGLHPFYCDKNAVKPTFEGMGGLRIHVNPGYFFQGGGLDYMSEKDNLKYGWVDKMPVEKDGIWDFGDVDDIDGNATIITDYKSHRWLITYNGKLPFQIVSRLEFLKKKKAGLQKEKQKAITDTKERISIRPKAEQEKEKEDAVKKIKEDAAKGKGWGDWSDKYLKDYQTDEQKQEEALRKTSEYYDEQLRIIEQNLQMSEKELQQPAIMIWFQHFKGFSKEGETGARILVRENPDYYNKKLPAGAAQLIILNMSYDALYPALPKAYTDLIKAVDFGMLKNMIGK